MEIFSSQDLMSMLRAGTSKLVESGYILIVRFV
jgi:hypothetical protein